MRATFPSMVTWIIAMGITGACTGPAAVVRQASFDHRCASERITVTRQSDNGRTVEMDVCGSVRRYQNLGRYGTDYTWVDVTTCPGNNAAESPRAR